MKISNNFERCSEITGGGGERFWMCLIVNWFEMGNSKWDLKKIGSRVFQKSNFGFRWMTSSEIDHPRSHEKIQNSTSIIVTQWLLTPDSTSNSCFRRRHSSENLPIALRAPKLLDSRTLKQKLTFNGSEVRNVFRICNWFFHSPTATHVIPPQQSWSTFSPTMSSRLLVCSHLAPSIRPQETLFPCLQPPPICPRPPIDKTFFSLLWSANLACDRYYYQLVIASKWQISILWWIPGGSTSGKLRMRHWRWAFLNYRQNTKLRETTVILPEKSKSLISFPLSALIKLNFHHFHHIFANFLWKLFSVNVKHVGCRRDLARFPV